MRGEQASLFITDVVAFDGERVPFAVWAYAGHRIGARAFAAMRRGSCTRREQSSACHSICPRSIVRRAQLVRVECRRALMKSGENISFPVFSPDTWWAVRTFCVR